jgi:replicative DNA helicase
MTTEATTAEAYDLEKAAIGGVLLEPDKFPILSGILDVSDFYDVQMQKVYRACLEMSQFGIEIGFYQVAEYLRGIPFDALMGLYDAALPGSMEYLCRTIKDYARRREAQKTLVQSIETLGAPGVDLAEQWEYLSTDFVKLLREDTSIISASNQVIATMKRMDSQTGGEFIKVGFRKIDEITGGAQRGEEWVIAGRTSTGKSSFAGMVALNMAAAGETIAYVPVEGSAHALMCRFLAQKTGIDLRAIRSGKLTPIEFAKLTHAAGVLGGYPLSIIEETKWAKIRANIQLLKMREPKLAAVFIDYLGLIEVGRNYREREREVAFLSADIKRLAKELDVAMFSLVQINRQSENRKDHRPLISDLRESGAIEQDADVILLLYRPAMYEESRDEKLTEVNIGKARDSATGSVNLSFEKNCVRFVERTE